jgi:hypothetical protein
MSDGSGGERPALGTTIDIPAASSWLANQHLAWAVRNRKGYRGHGVLMMLVTFAAFIAFGFVTDPELGIAFCVPVVWLLAMSAYGTHLLWTARGGSGLWASLRAGGIDVSTENYVMALPSATLRSWSITGPVFAFTSSSGTPFTFDLRRYGPIPEAAVARLLEADAPDLTPPADDALGRWTTTKATQKANRQTTGRLRPSTRVSGAVLFLGYPLILAVPALLAAAVSNVVTHGWDAGSQRTADGAVATTALVLGGLIVAMVVIFWWGGQRQGVATLGKTITVHADPHELMFVDRTDGTHSRVRWTAIERVAVDDEWIRAITGKPLAQVTIPVAALVPGGREALVSMLESRGAAGLPPVRSGEDPMVPAEPDHELGERT